MVLDAHFPEVVLTDVDGLVLAGMGSGSLSHRVLELLSPYSLSHSIVLVSRCESGSNYDDYFDNRSLEKYEKHGILVSAYEGLTPVKARIVLMLNKAVSD